MNFNSKILKYNDLKTNLKINIWDTKGQETYRSLTRYFYKGASIVIFVYDITNKKLFDEIKNYWYKEFQDKGERNVLFGLIGNKIDLYKDEQVSDE